MTSFSTTEMELFDNCGWKWDFNSLNRLGLEPIKPLKALFLGTLVHKALDILASTTLITDPHDFVFDHALAPEKRLDTCVVCGLHAYAHLKGEAIYNIYAAQRQQELTEHYTSKVGTEPSSLEFRDIINTIDLGRAMFKNYLKYYGTPLPKEFRYISTEQSIIVDIPGTEHCMCMQNSECACENDGCTLAYYAPYTYCRCQYTKCTCRVKHKLEGTLDGLVQHVNTGDVFILENKTFTYHPSYTDLQRTPQFMGYTWAANTLGFGVKGVFYNGLWKRAEVPKGKTEHDLFVREFIPFTQRELDTWADHARIRALKMGDPTLELTRRVHPVGGCTGVNNCNFKRPCDARYKQVNYDFIIKTEYTKRERTSIFEEEEVA